MSTEPTVPNAAQDRAWNGATGDYWVANAQRYDDGVARYRDAFLAAAAVEPGTRALDVGCGNGQVTLDLAERAGAGHALGVDLSAAMLDVARGRARERGIDNVAFRRADAQTHPFEPGSFDLAVSRHGAMFFDDPAAAFANVATALRPGGRLVLLVWGPPAGQEWMRSFLGALRAALPPVDGPGPGSLADPDRVTALLGGAGFTGVRLTELNRPMWFGPDAADAGAFLAGQFSGLLDGMAPDERPAALDDLHATLAAHEHADGVWFDSSSWLVTAQKPEEAGTAAP